MHTPDDRLKTITGHISADEATRNDYLYLGLEVPAGTSKISVAYDYSRTTRAESRAGSENIIDIGILAGGGVDDADQFRGWSGGARTEFSIAETDATPGYLPGPIPAGIWKIILGLYRISPDGCDYSVSVRMEAADAIRPGGGSLAEAGVPRGADDPSAANRADDSIELSAMPPAIGGRLRWYVGDLQAHTCHSDAAATVMHIARVAKLRGLDFLAVTDHNTTSHHRELALYTRDDLLLIPGMEITTSHGHANIWGLSSWVDFRCRDGKDIASRVRQVHSQHARISINHPFTDCPWEFGWVDGIDAIEVWQALWNFANQKAVQWWDELMLSGRRIAGVGGSDRHEPAAYDPYFPHQVGTPATRVFADALSTEAVLAAIAAGRVTISAGPREPWLDMIVLVGTQEARIGDEIHLDNTQEIIVQCAIHGRVDGRLELVVDGTVTQVRTVSGENPQVTLDPVRNAGVFVRTQVVSARSEGPNPLIVAMTNPVYCVRDEVKNAP